MKSFYFIYVPRRSRFDMWYYVSAADIIVTAVIVLVAFQSMPVAISHCQIVPREHRLDVVKSLLFAPELPSNTWLAGFPCSLWIYHLNHMQEISHRFPNNSFEYTICCRMDSHPTDFHLLRKKSTCDTTVSFTSTLWRYCSNIPTTSKSKILRMSYQNGWFMEGTGILVLMPQVWIAREVT